MRSVILVSALVCGACGLPVFTRPLPPLPEAPAPVGVPASYAVYSVVLDSLSTCADCHDLSELLVFDHSWRACPRATLCGGDTAAVGLVDAFRCRLPVRLVSMVPPYGHAYWFSGVRFNADSTRAHVWVLHLPPEAELMGYEFQLARRPQRAWVVTENRPLRTPQL